MRAATVLWNKLFLKFQYVTFGILSQQLQKEPHMNETFSKTNAGFMLCDVPPAAVCNSAEAVFPDSVIQLCSFNLHQRAERA